MPSTVSTSMIICWVACTTNVCTARVSVSTDDAEEGASGSMLLTSSDLELVYDYGDQTVGMRFNGVDIPQGATILNATVQFQVDESNSGPTSLTIEGQAADIMNRGCNGFIQKTSSIIDLSHNLRKVFDS